MSYAKLRGKIREVFGRQDDFAKVGTKIKHKNTSKKAIDTLKCACYHNGATRSNVRASRKERRK